MTPTERREVRALAKAEERARIIKRLATTPLQGVSYRLKMTDQWYTIAGGFDYLLDADELRSIINR